MVVSLELTHIDFKAKEPDFKPSCYYTNTKAREINDSKIIAIDYYYLEKLFKWFTEYWMLVEMLVMLGKEWPTLAIWWKQLTLNSNQIHFKNEYLGKPSWACLSHRSLEDGTRVQQIIIGYFVAPISHIFNYRWNVTLV